MKRNPASSKTSPSYPSVTDIERDRRGFLRLVGQIVAGVFAMGPLGRAALADDEPKPERLGGKVRPPEEPELLGRVAPPPEPPVSPPTGGVPRPPEDPPKVGCDPETEDCDDEDDKAPPRHPGTKAPPDPPVEIRRGGEQPAPTPPRRGN
jgi:hypothetical protein